MPRPYLDVGPVAEELLHRGIQLRGIAARKIAACGSHVGVEQGVTAEYVVFTYY
jgi:hypothetical protein